MKNAARALALLFAVTAPDALARKAAPLPPAPPPTSGLIDNVNGLAIGSGGELTHFTGLLIDRDGRIERRFTASEKRPEALAFRLDGKGRTLIPGFVDSHGRVLELGIALLTLDLSDTRNLAEAQAAIARHLHDNPGRKWIFGRGWDADRWGLQRQPTVAELDAVTGGTPALLASADGETGWANSAAMKAAALTPVSGALSPAQIAQIRRIVPAPAPKDRDLALDKAQRALLAAGITTIADMGMTIEDWQSYRRAGDRGALRVRFVGYASNIDQMIAIAGSEPTPWLYDDRLRMVGIHFDLDGTLGAHTAWLKAAYTDAPTAKGNPKIASTPLRNQMSRAAMDGFQISLSASGDAAVSESLAAVDELATTYNGDRRWRIENIDLADPADLPRFRARSVIASVQPYKIASQRRPALARLGETRGNATFPFASLLSNGARLAFGSGTPSGPLRPFEAIATAMTRTDETGEPFGGWSSQQHLPFEQAFAALTRGAAYAAFAERITGSLEPGQRADFLLIDRDISISSPRDIAQTRILESWISGRRVYVSAGQP